VVNTEAVRRLREPAAWILVAAAGLQLLAGIIMLFIGGGDGFKYRAYAEAGDGFFTHVTVVALAVLAVVLTTWGPAPSPQARTITMGALGVLGGVALFGVIALLGSLFVDSHYAGAGSKLAVFLYCAAKLAVVGAGGWFVLTVFQGMQPVRPQGVAQVPQGYPDFGYQQGQQVPPGQPGQPGQPQPFAQPYQQQPYQQPGYPQQYGQPQGFQQQAPGQPGAPGQPPAQPGQPQPGQAQFGQGQFGQAQPGQQPYGQSGGARQQDSDSDEVGEWTRAYGGGSSQEGKPPAQPGYGSQQGSQPGEQRSDEGGDWYRDNRPSQ
jgi:hypothetical protein